jgi:2-hydroxychromene-2-carboxylate isomerase
LARELGVPFRMPPRHPFNPLKVLRLLIALGSTRAALETAFDFIWGEGRDPDAEWPALCAALGVAADTPLINEPWVKETLTRNTAEAVAAGVWGVPTFEVNGELFWGADSVSFMNAFLADPTLLASPDMQRAATAEIGAERRIPGPTP